MECVQTVMPGFQLLEVLDKISLTLNISGLSAFLICFSDVKYRWLSKIAIKLKIE